MAPVSFENYTRAFVTVQPNPVVNNATVLVTSTTEEVAQLRITDNTGRIDRSKKSYSTLSAFASHTKKNRNNSVIGILDILPLV